MTVFRQPKCKFNNVVKILNIVCRKEMAARRTIPVHPIFFFFF